MKSLLIILLLGFSAQVVAVELYGVNLQGANRDQLRSAVKNSGLKLLKQAGKVEFYDQYRSDSALPLSTHLFLGFVKKTQAFAFAEYELEGLQHAPLQVLLEQKYGKAQISRPRFMTDKTLIWESNGIRIVLYQDWSTYSTRLMYTNPQALRELREEIQAQAIAANLQLTTLMQKAY